ncbi:MAG: WYL domain-containing protein [Clostridia bacterium]
MLEFSENKSFRVLRIYESLQKGEILNKNELSEKFGVTPKTIQRDIDEIRTYLQLTDSENDEQVKYDRIKKGYYLKNMQKTALTPPEKLAICKVLLESRGFCKKELDILIDKLISKTDKDEHIYDMILNEKFYYTELQHGKPLIDKIFDLSKNIVENQILEIEYTKKDSTDTRKHLIKPVSLMFSEYYFYVIAFMADGTKDFPTVFRVDRIASFKCTGERFSIPYKDRFSDGEFRKRVPFMYTGELKIVTFLYKGASIEAVLDRLPTAQILDDKDGVYKVRAEVYGDGIFMWLRSQGESVEILN